MRLDVPLIRQEKNMSCWHASARMLYAYRKNSSINPLPPAFQANTGLSPAAFVDLAKNIGLEMIPAVNTSIDWTFLEDILKKFGPIWAAGYWYELPHVVVITGVDPDGTLYVNDPGWPIPRVHNMLWFNEKVSKEILNPMMYLP